MTAPIFAHFDRIRIVNLPHRADRRREMRKQLQRAGLEHDQRVEFLAASAPADKAAFSSKGAHGCFLSHLRALQEAATAGGSLLILEDDCDFTDAMFDYQLPIGTQIFYGGYEARDNADLHTSDIIGSHFMGFSAEVIPSLVRYLERYQDDDFPADPRAVEEPGYDPAIRPGIDGAYVWFRRAHPSIETVFAKISVQRPSRTDVGNQKFFDRWPIMRDLANFGRRLRSRFTGPRAMSSDNLTYGGDSRKG